jgi:dihydroxy-acid dehydratase
MPDGDVGRSLDNPVNNEGGLIFLTGSLAPEGALVKTSAVPKNLMSFTGPTRLFAQEEDACEALHAGELNPGDIVVVRNKGPKGDPGMRISHRFLWMLTGKGMTDQVAFITDGRLSGSNKGCAIAHLSPEAAERGPLAVLQEGDLIEIDIPNGALNLKVDCEEIDQRLAAWKPAKQTIRKGYMALYSRLAKSPSRGANLNYEWD